MGRPALFLDRDGVINVEKNYLYRQDDFEFLPGVFETCVRYRDRGYALVIVTNQAGIARGYYTEQDYRHLTDWMTRRFRDHGVGLDGIYHCPHHPEFSGPCNCRKPQPGMLLSAAQDLDLDLGRSILVGDKESDIEAGINAGIARNILVRSGHAIKDESVSKATGIVDSIVDVTLC